MQDRPTQQELLGAIADLLEGDALAQTRGPLQHQIRVAGNLCRILEREVELGPACDAREVELLAELLGESGGPPHANDALGLSQQLVRRLDAEPPDRELERRAWPVLVEIVRGKLAIAKPGHDGFTFQSEQSKEAQGEREPIEVEPRERNGP